MQPLLQLSNNYCNEVFELYLAFLCRLGSGHFDCGLGRLGSLGRPGARSINMLLLCRRGFVSWSLGRSLDRRLGDSLGRGLLSSHYGRLGRSLRRCLLERGLGRGDRLPVGSGVSGFPPVPSGDGALRKGCANQPRHGQSAVALADPVPPDLGGVRMPLPGRPAVVLLHFLDPVVSFQRTGA